MAAQGEAQRADERGAGIIPAAGAGSCVLVGEVRTGLLAHSRALTEPEATGIVTLRPGSQVRVSARPVPHCVSPDLTLGVHCPVPSASGARRDGLGTVLSRASVTSGRLVQASTHGRIVLGGARSAGRRRPWAHHLAHPGMIEVGGRLSVDDLADGFLSTETGDGPGSTLDLGAVCGRLLDQAQESPFLDQKPPFRARRTRFRFALLPCGHPAVGESASRSESAVADTTSGRSPVPGHVCRVGFVVADETVRTLRIHGSGLDLVSVVGLCEDLALHDWLLTTVQYVVTGSRVRAGGGGRLPSQLKPVIDHLLHVWMPGARIGEELLPVWTGLEQRLGFSRQWESLVGWIRDQLALALLASLGDGAR
ncbi:SCO2521 family protein [Frankia sp. AiPs1]|uniref:SCO2521 family protein n=1 Tax=Frankia sp. AiPs1 TaxID=573493 RepID=UPI0020432C39|nr:SCO2521 family protein [Frankia sp. AiPs1]MCM3922503.1 SCO2521 family protein [Frankia sp. AiPs1]